MPHASPPSALSKEQMSQTHGRRQPETAGTAAESGNKGCGDGDGGSEEGANGPDERIAVETSTGAERSCGGGGDGGGSLGVSFVGIPAASPTAAPGAAGSTAVSGSRSGTAEGGGT
jgi:hypothetical protein